PRAARPRPRPRPDLARLRRLPAGAGPGAGREQRPRRPEGARAPHTRLSDRGPLLLLQVAVQLLPGADRGLPRVAALDVLVPQLAELVGTPRPRGVRVIDRLGGAGAVVVGLEPGRVLGQVHRAPAGQHRAERTRITVGDPDPALCAIVALQQGEQALAAAGEYVAGGHPGRLHERGVTRLLRRLPALDLRLLPDRTDDVERDLHRPVALFPVDLRDLDPGRPVPAAPLEHRLVEVPADPRVIDEPLQFSRGVPAGPAG